MAIPGEGADWEIDVPPELEGGVYANFLGTWHTAHEFTLDFAAVPPTVVFNMIRTIHANMTLYEETFGAIRYPEPPEEER